MRPIRFGGWLQHIEERGDNFSSVESFGIHSKRRGKEFSGGKEWEEDQLVGESMS